MESEQEARWLAPEESEAWLALWTMTVWLPVRLDAQLRQDSALSLPEYHALSQISMAPDRTLRLSELAAVANMTLSHLSRVVSRLEKAGWVRRVPDPTDGRYTLARLTDEGWHKVAAAAPSTSTPCVATCSTSSRPSSGRPSARRRPASSRPSTHRDSRGPDRPRETEERSPCGPCGSPSPERPGTSGPSPSPPWNGPDTTSCASAVHSAWT
ncbi:MarR family winged helix-turn-helix transcriptional regulator [Streptomyces sp. INA 01156]